MGEILEEHMEWATVHRMCEMLPAEELPYKLTASFALFTGILCWTLQRIRTRARDGDPISEAMSGLKDALEACSIQDFFDFSVREDDFNDFSVFETDHNYANAMEALIRLRDAVAHGDARSVRPFNSGGSLIGFELTCRRKPKRGDAGWCRVIKLNRRGLHAVGTRLADRFCEALDPVGIRRIGVEARDIQEDGSSIGFERGRE